ncbi:hypothetical protein psal_cds_1186 [Pandoravirus salinus]|uniref:F-box incomplete domain containing protein n=1 Tax=Pandoravirus salinus TaxID=1349410 RepID=S4W574_9VIRU|nr:hypothetical protein psal_cds_1186 [Pandoravirus salinus]AGO85470.1 hypothetical protein psal_cds_1186 [Pandoravirus salinus]
MDDKEQQSTGAALWDGSTLCDDALDALFHALASADIASAAAARLVCRRWGEIGARALAAVRRQMAIRAAAPSGRCSHFYTAQGEITCALALDSRPRLMRALDTGGAGVDDPINLFRLNHLLASTGAEMGVVATEKRVRPRAALDSHVPCDIGVESHTGVPPAELAVFYSAVGCFDLLIERGARIDPARMDGLLSRFLASCPWVNARVCVGSTCRDPFSIRVARGTPWAMRYIDPIPIVQRLLTMVPPRPAGTRRAPRDMVHPLVSLATHLALMSTRGMPVRLPSRGEVKALAALLVDAGYTMDATHAHGFGLANNAAAMFMFNSGLTMDKIVALSSMLVREIVHAIGHDDDLVGAILDRAPEPQCDVGLCALPREDILRNFSSAARGGRA